MKTIILDRDGVINYDSYDYIKSPEEWHPLPGSLEAIARLNRAGYRVCVATNQSGIARGLYDVEMLHRIHEKLLRELSAVGGYIEAIFFCPHHPDERCDCRKPQPGMLYQIQKKYQVNFADTFFVGDTLTDVQVAHAVGCRPILILSEKGLKAVAEYPALKNELQFESLAKAVDYILSV